MPHDVFISHSSADKRAADAACAVLEGRGIKCWIAPRDIRPGADWGEAIINAIEQSRIMLLLLSSKANSSPQIKREVERAVHRSIIIIPVRLENVMPARSLEYFPQHLALDGCVSTSFRKPSGELGQNHPSVRVWFPGPVFGFA
jgi:hypothetical protein